jgi:dihydrofolate reductase
MANFIYIATSLDGYIADKEGGIDWLANIPNPEKSDFGFSEFMEKVDALVMGRNTFETILSFGEWPYNKKVFVLSNTLKIIPDRLKEKAELISGKAKEIVEDLSDKGYKNLYIDGGMVIQSFLEEDLIDEMVITRVPIILGDGIPLFVKSGKQINFKKVKTEVLNDQLVKSYYIK